MTKEQRRGRKKPRLYGFSNLPMGEWTATVKPRRFHIYSGFDLIHSDAGTGDRVEAMIVEGDYQYSAESMGIPLDLDPKNCGRRA